MTDESVCNNRKAMLLNPTKQYSVQNADTHTQTHTDTHTHTNLTAARLSEVCTVEEGHAKQKISIFLHASLQLRIWRKKFLQPSSPPKLSQQLPNDSFLHVWQEALPLPPWTIAARKFMDASTVAPQSFANAARIIPAISLATDHSPQSCDVS